MTSATSTELAVVPADSTVTSSDFSSVTGSSTVVSGLLGNTLYTAYAYSACGSDTAVVTFLTKCNVFTAPFSEDFEGGNFTAATNYYGTDGSMSACWTTGMTGYQNQYMQWAPGEGFTPNGSSSTSTYNPGPYGDATSGYGIYMFSAGSNYSYAGTNGSRLESPLIDVSGLTKPYLTFNMHYWQSYQYSLYKGEFYVEVSNDNGVTWESFKIQEGPIASQTTKLSPYESFGLPLSSYVGDTIQVAFVFKNFYYYDDVAIDDIEIDEAPSCYVPVVGVDSLSYTYVDFNYLSFETVGYYYTTANATTVSAGSASTSPFTVSSLNSDSAYTFYFFNECGSGNSDTVGPITINPPTFNACGANTTFPFTEDFEVGSPKLGCWVNETVSGSRSWNTQADGSTSYTPNAANSGSYYAELPYSSSGVARLISPIMDMSAYVTGQVTFAFFNEEWYGDQNTLAVEYRLSATDPWVEIWSSATNVAAWTNATAVTLGTSSTMQFAWRGDLAYGYNIGVDSIVFDEGPTCIAPINLTAYDVTDNSASITWTGLTSAYSVSYGEVGNAATLTAAANDTMSLSNLTHQTDYYVVVTADCGGGTYSDPSDTLFFTTACLPDSLGWTEGFEGASNPAPYYYSTGYDATINDCWSFYREYAYAYTTVLENTSSTYAPNNGAGIQFAYTGYGYEYWLYTPQLHDLGSGLNQVRFYYKDRSSSYFDIYVVAVNAQDPSATEIYLDTLEWNNSGKYEEVLVEVPVLPAGYEYIAIGGEDAYGYLMLDDFAFEPQPTCKPATGGEVTAVSNSNATFTVQAANAPTIGTWQFELVQPDVDGSGNLVYAQGTGSKVTTTTGAYSWNTLTSSSNYGVYARRLCGAGDTSDWRGPWIFTTACDANSMFPYVMEFESDWEAEKGCWDTLNTAYDYYSAKVYKSTSTTYSQSSRNLQFYYYADYGYGEAAHATTQAMSIPSTGAVLGFKYGAYASSTATITNSFAVMAREFGTVKWDTIGLIQGNDLVTNTSSYTYYYDADGNEVQFMVPLNLLGKDVQFNLVYHAPGSQPYYFNVDSLYLGTPPACPNPQNLAQVSATENSVTVSWLSPLNQNQGSRVVWGTVGFTQGTGATGTVIGDTTGVLSPFTIAGLSPDSMYDVYVQDSCSATDTTDWLGPFTIITECAALTAPHVEDFQTISHCWDNDNNGAYYNWRLTSTAPYYAPNFIDHTGNGSYAVWVDGSYYPEAPILTSQAVDMSALSDPVVDFFVGNVSNYGNTNTLVVDLWDGAAWNDSAVVYSTNSAAWERVEIDLSNYTVTGPVKVRFQIVMNGTPYPFYNDMVIDDVRFIERPVCFSAEDAMVTATSANSADVSWTPGTSNATGWIINVTDQNSGVQTSYYTTSNSTYSISGLSGGGNYCVNVAEVCSTGDTTAPTATECFSTSCGLVYAPYTQDFASYTYDFNCWSRSTNVSAQGNGSVWTSTYGDWMVEGAEHKWGNTPGQTGTYASTAYNYAVGVDGSSPFSAVPVLETPMIDVSGLLKPQLEFHVLTGQNGDTVVTWLGDTVANGQNVLVADLWDGAAWNDSIYVNDADMAVWDTAFFELNQFNITGPVQVRFTVYKEAVIPAFDDILLDNFSITEDPAILTCSDIDSAYAFDEVCGGATIAWGTVDTAGVFTQGSPDSNSIGTIVYVGTDSVDMAAATMYWTTDTVAVITGLTPGTKYFYWAQDSCISGNTSAMIGPFSFTTATAPMPMIPTLTAINDTVTTTSDWTFTAGDTTLAYTWTIDGMTYTGATVNASFGANGTVDVSLSMSNDCGSVDTTFQITVTQIGLEEYNFSNVSIYPNPSNGAFNVAFSAPAGEDYSISLTDAMGRVIFTTEGETLSDNIVRIDSDLAAGVYIVKTIVGGEANVGRIVVRK
jgi:hypothetical protein